MSETTQRRLRRRRRRASSDGAMTLVEHLRELRIRLIKSGIAIAVGTVVGWIYYDQLFAVLRRPFDQVVADAQAQGRTVVLALTGVVDPFTLQMQISAIAGVVLSAPIWLYQLWRFVTPGLHRHEKRWGYLFVAIASPLFFAGVVLAYVVLPQGLAILFGFTPSNVENIVSVDRYLDFFVRTVLVFGVGFLLPLLVVLLNLAGVLSGRRLLSWWRGIIVGVFLFAAVATPTGDPWNMTLLAAPILLLCAIAVGISLLNDRRRRLRRGADSDFDQWDDDEASPTPVRTSRPEDDVATPLGDTVDEHTT